MPVLAPLKPMFAGILDAKHAQDRRPVAEQRASIHAAMDQTFATLYAPQEPCPSEREFTAPVQGGEITLRAYAPVQAPEKRACYVYFHGGGFWLGTLDQFDGPCRQIARAAGCVVVAVDYRLAPEHKFPVAAEDSYAALLWIVEHARELGVDPGRVAVGGGSAGGNLAAVVALMARDRGGPQLALQVLEIPVTDFTNLEPLGFPQEGVVVPNNKGHYRAFYLNDESEAQNPYASPLLASELGGLPPALVMCCEYDTLAPEGEAYARRLAEAGVPVDYVCWPGQFHGSAGLAALIPQEAAAYKAKVAGALRSAFGEMA